MEEKLASHLKNMILAGILCGIISYLDLLSPNLILTMALPGIFIVLTIITRLLR